MNFFDQIAARSFRKDSEGMTVFYPYGKNRTGYLARTEAEQVKITSGLKTHYTRLAIYLIAALVLGQLKYFHTLSHFSSFMQTVFLVGAAGVWGYRSFLTEVTSGMPATEKKVATKSFAPQIVAAVFLILLVGFVIVMSSKLPKGKLPDSVPSSAPVAVPATVPSR